MMRLQAITSQKFQVNNVIAFSGILTKLQFVLPKKEHELFIYYKLTGTCVVY